MEELNIIPFKDAPMGMFYGKHGLAYTKISDTQAVIITNGKIVDYEPDLKVYSCVSN